MKAITVVKAVRVIRGKYVYGNRYTVVGKVHCFIARFIKQQPAYIGVQKEQEGYLPQTDRASAFVHQNVLPG